MPRGTPSMLLVFPAVLAASTAVAVLLVTLAPRGGAGTTAGVAPTNDRCVVLPENPVDPSVGTVEYRGKPYGFCCGACVEPFRADPAKYVVAP